MLYSKNGMCCRTIFINRKAGEIICLVVSVCLGLWDLRCAPPRGYMTMLCTTDLHWACTRGTLLILSTSCQKCGPNGPKMGRNPFVTRIILAWLYTYYSFPPGFAGRYWYITNQCVWLISSATSIWGFCGRSHFKSIGSSWENEYGQN